MNMKIKIILSIAALATLATATDPFPLGHTMMSQGAIVEAEGASGRSPWVSAAYYRDTLTWGASAAVVSYHGGGAAARYAFGGFAAFDVWRFGGDGTFGPVVCKASMAQLDALGIYYEQDAAVSVGTSWRFLSWSLDGHIRRIGLRDVSDDYRTAAALGAAIYAQTRRVSAAVAAQGITVSTTGDRDADPAETITARIGTVRNRYGSQGAMLVITPSDEAPLRFVLAQEYRIGNAFALSASIASKPTTIGFGITIEKSPISSSAAAVNHPFLGWSKGVIVDYGR